MMSSPIARYRRNNSNHRRRTVITPLSKVLLVSTLLLCYNVRDVAAAGRRHRRHLSSVDCFVVPTSSSSSVHPSAATGWALAGGSSLSTRIVSLARLRDDDDDYDDGLGYGYDYDYNVDDEDDRRPQRRLRRRMRPSPMTDDLGTPPLTGSSPDDTSLSIPSPFGRGDAGLRLPPSVSSALLAGVFVLGMGTGVTVDSQINTNPRDLASRDAVDKNAPNPTLCTTYGASAMAFDQRVFVSFNPFNVYVAQADVKPACVLRPANVVPILKERKLLNDDEIRGCKMNMNTWAFVGDLNDQPQLSCVYKSEDAQNEFLDDPKRGIGEDYLDDDYSRAMSMRKKALEPGKMKTGKMVKDTLTEGQKRSILEIGENAVVGAAGDR
ncbi:hypothetical protein ACHAXA_009390 [Cyclostephanos tholiformis]|uniref:DUF3172 domain-containing protein n=1 Tax=Cyclostephanos tholiformis TaxID=382380 RepID=A0ABD3RK40_9STRA